MSKITDNLKDLANISTNGSGELVVPVLSRLTHGSGVDQRVSGAAEFFVDSSSASKYADYDIRIDGALKWRMGTNGSDNWNLYRATIGNVMTFDTSGRMTLPQQPYFCVGSMTHVSGGAWKSGTILANRGGWGYDSTTGIITVPSGISGLFEISTHMLYNTANTAANGGQMVLRVNGAFCDEAFASTGANPLMTTGCSQIRALAGSDQITVTATGSGWYSAATGNVISVKFLG